MSRHAHHDVCGGKALLPRDRRTLRARSGKLGGPASALSGTASPATATRSGPTCRARGSATRGTWEAPVSQQHLSDVALVALARGARPRLAEHSALHLSRCARCRSLLADFVALRDRLSQAPTLP